MGSLLLVENPLSQHFLGKLRDRNTPDALNGGEEGARNYQRLGLRLSRILLTSAIDWQSSVKDEIGIPFERASAVTGTGDPCLTHQLAEHLLLGVSIKRAGNIILQAFTDMFPGCMKAALDMSREEHPPFNPVEGTHELPDDIAGLTALLKDCMLATGGSAVRACTRLKDRGVRNIVFIGWVGSPEGVARMHKDHPDVPVVLAAMDERLDGRGYIRGAGLGDAGDRLYGLKKPVLSDPPLSSCED